MSQVSIAEAKNTLTRLIHEAERGEAIHITRHGKSVAVLLSEEAFGHVGMGGSVGFADPRARLSFGYSMNRQGGGLGANLRGQALTDAVYRALGYRQPPGGGIWFT